MWQLVRNPVHYSRLVLLLMLATAVGMFAASFGTTIDRSYADRAGYESGAQLRLHSIRRADATGPSALADNMRELTGAVAASPVVRVTGSLGGNVFDRTNFTILGVDPETFDDVAFFRDDYADASLSSLLDTLAEDTQPGEPLIIPDGTRWLGAWVNATDLRGRIGFELRVQDAAGRFHSFMLGPDNGAEFTPGWNFLLADLSRSSQDIGATPFAGTPPRAPLALSSISVRFFTRVSAASGAFLIDDVVVSGEATPAGRLATDRMAADPQRTLQPFVQGRGLINFDDVSAWSPVTGTTPQRLNDEVRRAPSATSGSALELIWRPVGSPQPNTHGVRPRVEERPLSVLASEAFLVDSGLRPGDGGNMFVNNA
jgi:hypothetical protein